MTIEARADPQRGRRAGGRALWRRAVGGAEPCRIRRGVRRDLELAGLRADAAGARCRRSRARSGVGAIHYKDERGRFGLKSFKALGGAYAVANVLRKKVAAATGSTGLVSRDLLSGEFADIVGAATVTCATDGNHGRSVAWGAQLFGCRCVIFVHEHVSQGRRDAIAQLRRRGARGEGQLRRRRAARGGHRGGERLDRRVGHLVSRLSRHPARRHARLRRDGGRDRGSSSAASRRRTCSRRPASVRWRPRSARTSGCNGEQRRPAFVVVEPTRADCVYQSLAAGHPVVVGGSLDTVMAGLACGEVSELAWEILHHGANAAVAIDDRYALEAMRTLALPATGEPAIVAGETGGTGLAALLAARDDPGDPGDARPRRALAGPAAGQRGRYRPAHLSRGGRAHRRGGAR